MKNFACIVLLCLVTACAQSEREASIDSTESYPVIEAMVEVPAGNFWMGCNLELMPSATSSAKRRCAKCS